MPGKGYNDLLSLNKEQFIEALSIILNRGSRQEVSFLHLHKHQYDELFDKIDVSAEGVVDWDKIATHFIVDCHERDERTSSTSIPQWKELKTLHSPHKDNIQKITRLNNFERYLSISKVRISFLAVFLLLRKGWLLCMVWICVRKSRTKFQLICVSSVICGCVMLLSCPM